jgi:WD40 repeat protein
MKALSTLLIRPAALALAIMFTLNAASAQTVNSYLVSDFDSGNVQVFSAATNQLLASIQAGASPASAVVSPDGRFAYVPNVNSNYLSVLDLSIGAEIARIHLTFDPTMGNSVAAITADSTRVLAIGGPGELAVINTADFSVALVPLAPICDDAVPANCDSDPNDIHVLGIATAGNKAYLNLDTSFSVRLVCVDLNTLGVSSVPGTALGFNFTLNSIVTSPDGQFVIAKRTNPSQLLVIDTGSNALVQIVTPDIFPRHLQVTTQGGVSGGVFVYVVGTDVASGNVIVQAYALNAGILTLSGSATLFPFRDALSESLSPDSRTLYVGSGPIMTVVDTQSIVSNPAHAVVARFPVGNSISGVRAGSVRLQPLPTAPTVTGVTPNLILNNDTSAGRTIQVSGTNFSPDALVRIGNLDPFAPGAGAGASSLQAIVPGGTPAQSANLIVIDPNPAAAPATQHQSGIVRGQFVITSPPTFQPVNQVVVGNFGNSTAAVLNVSTNAGLLPTVPGILGADGIAIAPDGERAYIGQFLPAAVTVVNLVQNRIEARIVLDADSILGQSDGLLITRSPVFDGPVVYTTAPLTLADGNHDQQLFVIDANPAHGSTTLNTVLTTQQAGQDLPPFVFSGGIATTLDGRYVYTNVFQDFTGPRGWLIVFDVVSGTTNTIPASSLNVAGLQAHIEVSPDGRALLLAGLDNAIHVFDIAANPMVPSPLAVITSQPPSGFLPLNLSSFRIPANQPGLLIAFDPFQNIVASFNFDRASLNFAQLGTAHIPGTENIAGSAGLDVTPDGKLIYAVISIDDNVAVLDAAKVANSDPTALLTTILTGLAPSAIAVRPGTPTPLTTAQNPTVTVTPTQGITISFSGVTSSGATTATTTNTTRFNAPAGFQPGAVPVYYEVATTASFATAVVCFHYDPAQVPSPESSLRLAHYNQALDPATNQIIGWEDVTVPGSPDTTAHSICGQVSSFSPFVIGIASVDFMFNSLLADISTLPPAMTPVGIMRSLRAKALAARSSADRGNRTSARNQLSSLINQLQAISGKEVSMSDANNLISESNIILGRL